MLGRRENQGSFLQHPRFTRYRANALPPKNNLDGIEQIGRVTRILLGQANLGKRETWPPRNAGSCQYRPELVRKLDAS